MNTVSSRQVIGINIEKKNTWFYYMIQLLILTTYIEKKCVADKKENYCFD